MTSLTQALNAALLHFVWQGIVIGFLLWIALFLLRRRSANVRYVVGCATLLLLALAPVITAAVAYTPRREAVLSSKAFFSLAETKGAGTLAVAPAGVFSGFHALEAWVLPVWGLGVAFFALRLMWCWGHTSALRRTGTPANDGSLTMVSSAAERIGVTRTVRVLISSLADVPSVIGWARPVLLLPVAVAAGLTPEQLEALIAHELAHVRRHDYLVNLAQTFVETILFYHPAVWWMSSRIRYERELCCDDLAVAALGDATRYARALARLEEIRILRPSLAMGAARGPLFHRIERLLGGDGVQPGQGPSRLVCAVGLLIGVACFAINMGWAEGWQGVRGESGAMVQDFFPPLPPMPPLAPMLSMKRMAPMPLIKPVPPMPLLYEKVSPELYVAIAQAAQGSEASWVLFRGDRVIARSSAGDEAEARAALESSGGGDALWFRLGDKSYVTRDRATLDLIAETGAPAKAAADAQAAIQQEMQQLQRENELRQARMQEDLQANLAALRAQIPSADTVNTFEQLNSIRIQLDKMRRNLDEMAARLGKQELQEKLQDTVNKMRRLKLNIEQAEAARQLPPQIPDLLRDAVSSGKAQPAK